MVDKSSRRRFLATAVAISTVGLSGCGSSGSSTTTDAGGATTTDKPMRSTTAAGTPTDTPTPTPTPADTPAPTDTPTETPEPTDTPTETPEPTDTPTETPEPTDTPTPAPDVSNWTEWRSYQYNSRNWGHSPDAVGPHDSVSVDWKFEVDEKEVNSSPIFVDGKLFVGGGGPGDSSGTLYALDAKTGKEQWRKDFQGAYTGGAAYSPDRGLIYACGGDGLIEAYQTNGNRFWEFEIKSDETLTAPAVGDGHIYVGANSGRLYKFNDFDGTQKWIYKAQGAITGAPAYHDGTVYITSQDELVHALNTDKSNKWKHGFGNIVNGLAKRGGTAYATGSDGTIRAINNSGSDNWTRNVGSPVLTPPAVTENHVFAGTQNGTLVATNRDSSGTQHWRFTESEDRLAAPPVVADGTVYFGSNDSNVYAVDVKSGQKEWSYETDLKIDNASPLVAGGRVFIGSDDSYVYALS